MARFPTTDVHQIVQRFVNVFKQLCCSMIQSSPPGLESFSSAFFFVKGVTGLLSACLLIVPDYSFFACPYLCCCHRCCELAPPCLAIGKFSDSFSDAPLRPVGPLRSRAIWRLFAPLSRARLLGLPGCHPSTFKLSCAFTSLFFRSLFILPLRLALDSCFFLLVPAALFSQSMIAAQFWALFQLPS